MQAIIFFEDGYMNRTYACSNDLSHHSLEQKKTKKTYATTFGKNLLNSKK